MKLFAFPIQLLPHFSAKHLFTAGKVPRESDGAATLHSLFWSKAVAKHRQEILDFIITASPIHLWRQLLTLSFPPPSLKLKFKL